MAEAALSIVDDETLAAEVKAEPVEIEADPMLTESIKEECEEEETMEVEVDPWWIHSSSPRDDELDSFDPLQDSCSTEALGIEGKILSERVLQLSLLSHEQFPEILSSKVQDLNSQVTNENPEIYGHDEDLQKCVSCQFTYTHLTEYKNHQKSVHGFRHMNYPCSKCDHVAPRLARLEIHMKKHEYRTKQKKLKAPSRNESKRNSTGHAEDLNELFYQEPQADFEELKQFPDHLLAEQEDPNMLNVLKVEEEDSMNQQDGSHEVGDGEFDHDQSYSQATETTYQCMGCEYLTNDRNELREHRRTEHGVAVNDKDENSEDGELQKCIVCPFTYTNLIEYKNHQKYIHGFRHMNYPCSKCDHVAPRLARLEIHMKKHEPKKSKKRQAPSKNEMKHHSAGYAEDSNVLLYQELQTDFEELKKIPEHFLATEEESIIPKVFKVEKEESVDQQEEIGRAVIPTGQITEDDDEETKYPCGECDFVSINKGSLKQHKEAKHIGIRYPCDQCKYSATQQSSLKRHKQSKHEGIRYPCNMCEYAATTAGHLRSHKINKHDG